MAKARAATTPAKASKAKSPMSAKATRSSPRRATPSVRAQEAGELGNVKAGRVAKASPAKKKAIPAKKAAPAKKASPVKKVSPAKKTTPAKKPSPTKKTSPKKATASAETTPAKSSGKTVSTGSNATKSPSPAKKSAKQASPSAKKTTSNPSAMRSPTICTMEDMVRDMKADFQRRCDRLKAPLPSEAEVSDSWRVLQINREYDGNRKEDDDEYKPAFRSEYRKLKKEMRRVLGDHFDSHWKRGSKPAEIGTLWGELTRGEQEDERDVVHSIEPEEPVRPSSARGRGRSPAKKAPRATSKSPAKELAKSPSRVASGRVTKRAGISRSRSPVKRARRQSIEAPAATRRNSARQMLARSPSKSPANSVRSRSMSPAKMSHIRGPGASIPTEIFQAGDSEPNLRPLRDRSPAYGIGDDAQGMKGLFPRKVALLTMTSR